jgi:hypothetical protein
VRVDIKAIYQNYNEYDHRHSKEGNRIMGSQRNQEYIFEPEVETMKGWENQINNGSRIMPTSCPLTPILL